MHYIFDGFKNDISELKNEELCTKPSPEQIDV